jgi:3-isopropylmalate/(R)-2-methylmalate dehydratase large subunit
MTIVCGDSHTSTHGAFGALAFGIGTSEVEHVLATQTLPRPAAEVDADPLRRRAAVRRHTEGRHPRHDRPHRGRRRRRARPRVRGRPDPRALDGGAAHDLQHVDRGRRTRGDDRPDETTFAYLEGRPGAPKGADWEQALDRWRELRTDDDATFDTEVVIDVAELEPQVTWGTNPGMVLPVGGAVPDPAVIDDPDERAAVERRSSTWTSSRASRSATSPSIASSSARARTHGSRISGGRGVVARKARQPARAGDGRPGLGRP